MLVDIFLSFFDMYDDVQHISERNHYHAGTSQHFPIADFAIPTIIAITRSTRNPRNTKNTREPANT